MKENMFKEKKLLNIKQNFTNLIHRVGLACGLAIFAALAFFSAQALPAHADSMAFVRLVHASPDAGTVDVFMDGKKLLSNFQFGTFTGYTPVTAGSHRIQVAVIGTGANAAVLTQTISVNANTAHTVAALATKATGFSLQVFGDNNLVAGNMAKVRVYHLSAGLGVVNVAKSGSIIIRGLSYAQASNYVDIPAGSYTLDVTVTGDNTTIAAPAQLKAWTVTSIFAVSSSSNGSSKLQVVEAQVNGMPGMPGTGSDPHMLPGDSQPSPMWSWLLGGLALLVVGSSVAVSINF